MCNKKPGADAPGFFPFERKTGFGPAAQLAAPMPITLPPGRERPSPRGSLRSRVQASCHQNKTTVTRTAVSFLSGKRDSDPRPQPWQGCALPTELFPQYNPVPRGWDYKGTEFFLICKLFLNFFVRVCSRVAEYGFAVFAVYHNLAVLAYFTFKDFLCKLVDQFSLNQSFDRTGTIFRIVAVLYHVVFKRFRE